jgi:hypothetical protein
VDDHRNSHCVNQDREQRNYEVTPSALAAGEQGDAIRGSSDHSVHDLDPQDEADRVYAKGDDDSRPVVPLAVPLPLLPSATKSHTYYITPGISQSHP